MKNTSLIICCLTLFSTSIMQADELKPGKQVASKVEVTTTIGSKKSDYHFWISLPRNYGKKEKSPLLIFLHGRGEWGNNLERVKKHGPPRLLQKENNTPFIVVSPQSPEGEWWSVNKLSQLLDHILKTTKADPDRVYLTGLSLGGFGTWAWLAKEPERFAAAIPICGGGNPKHVEKYADIPIWVFHGAKDNVVRLDRSKVMVDALKKIEGNRVKFTDYPNAYHDSWTKTYNNKEIYDWLLEHRRKDSGTKSRK